jgi:hypothetical protein
MSEPVRILVSNDDGYASAGIQALAGALEGLGEVWVVPESEQSAASRHLPVPAAAAARGPAALVRRGRNAHRLLVHRTGPGAEGTAPETHGLGDQPRAQPGQRRDLLGDRGRGHGGLDPRGARHRVQPRGTPGLPVRVGRGLRALAGGRGAPAAASGRDAAQRQRARWREPGGVRGDPPGQALLRDGGRREAIPAAASTTGSAATSTSTRTSPAPTATSCSASAASPSRRCTTT